MTTSGVYTLTVNRDQIIRLALLNINKLDENETPTAQTVTDCAAILNMMVKQWQGRGDFAPGLKTFARRHGHLFLSAINGQYSVGPTATGWCNDGYVTTTTTTSAAAGQAVINVTSASGITVGDNIGVQVSGGSNLFWTTVKQINSLAVTLNANLPFISPSGAIVYDYTTTAQQPMFIETAQLRDSFLNDFPLRLLTIQEYDALPSKDSPTNISDPSAIYYEWQLGSSYVYTDVAGAADVTKHIALTYMEECQVFVNPTDTPEYPYEWYLPLALNLSKLITPMYEAPWTQLQEENARTALAIAQNKGAEVINAYFMPGEMP